MAPMGELAALPNLGEESAARLEAVGIGSLLDLEEAGSVEAYQRVNERFPEETSLNLLWALEGALLDVSWLDIPPERKEELRAELK